MMRDTADAETNTPYRDCGDLLIVRQGRGSRCIECLLDHLAVGSRPNGRRYW